MSVAASQAPEPPAVVNKKKGFELPPKVEKFVIPLVVLIIAIVMPFFTDNQAFIQQCAVAIAYVVMALGLNIVVGFAGLLDLGYVAFFAIGAYCVGWFASGYWAYANNEKGIHFLVGGFIAEREGIHLNFLLVLVIAVIATAHCWMNAWLSVKSGIRIAMTSTTSGMTSFSTIGGSSKPFFSLTAAGGSGALEAATLILHPSSVRRAGPTA